MNAVAAVAFGKDSGRGCSAVTLRGFAEASLEAPVQCQARGATNRNHDKSGIIWEDFSFQPTLHLSHIRMGSRKHAPCTGAATESLLARKMIAWLCACASSDRRLFFCRSRLTRPDDFQSDRAVERAHQKRSVAPVRSVADRTPTRSCRSRRKKRSLDRVNASK